MSINSHRGAAWNIATFRRIGGDRRPEQPERGDRHGYAHNDMFNADARAVIDAEFEIIGPEQPCRGLADSVRDSWRWIRTRLWPGF